MQAPTKQIENLELEDRDRMSFQAKPREQLISSQGQSSNAPAGDASLVWSDAPMWIRVTEAPRLADHDDDPGERQGDTGLIVAPEKPKLAKPPLWKVVMLNDDYTPMEFVVEVLQTFFGMNGEKATQIMLMVHRTGKGTCGIYPKDIAETKCAQVNQYAQENQHPLVSEIEPADDES
jgi:ATP-dependent Clp protease adaptor protein ClpS